MLRELVILFSAQEGYDLVECVMILSLIALVGVVGVMVLGPAVSATLVG
jgi:hypothetical protein